jgi:glycosyltransferase involved in cell wall biosynthesis
VPELPLYPARHRAEAGGRGRLSEFAPHAVHIATEGPIGHAVRRYCLRAGLRFTSSYHTQFPEYLRLRWPVPVDWTYAYLRRFHGSARLTLVPTVLFRERLAAHGFRNVVVWARGVDTSLFHPRDKGFLDAPRPIAMYVGRIAIEKNLEAFLSLALPGSKFVVGDGPARERLAHRYPEARFFGYRHGEDLAAYLAAADVLVFPSRTDTFGLVLLEAMASGVPVAAYPVPGPSDVVIQNRTGVLHEDLQRATLGALELGGEECIAHARRYSWHRSAEAFATLIEPAGPSAMSGPFG